MAPVNYLPIHKNHHRYGEQYQHQQYARSCCGVVSAQSFADKIARWPKSDAQG